MNTYMGHSWDVKDVSTLKPKIEDIAHALSLVNRYNGHTKRPYSVALHSIILSKLVHPKHAMAALLHDASEAYIPDMPSEIKQMLPDFIKLQKKIEESIAAAFKLSTTLPTKVELWDKQMREAEVFALTDWDYRSNDFAWRPEEVAVLNLLAAWDNAPPEVIEKEFLKLFEIYRNYDDSTETA